ncbi:MAG: hypothetical protein ACOX6M_06930 [Armatimonadota bacterium]
MAIRMVTEVLEANRACYPARLAQGLLQERLEDPTPAVSTFVVLARDLLEAGNAEAARWVARRGMSLRGDHRLVDVLLRIARQAPEWAEEDVSFCRERLPDAPELLWHDSQAADAAETCCELRIWPWMRPWGLFASAPSTTRRTPSCAS